MTARCPHVDSVEALRDARLTFDEATGLRAHLVGCGECSSQLAQLEAMGTALLSLPEPELGPAGEAAARRRLLNAAQSGERAPSRLRRASMLFAGAALAAGVPLIAREAPWRALAPISVSPSGRASALDVRVEPGPATRWSRSGTPDADVLALDEGRLHVAVSRHDSSRRLVVTLPDGELVDVGTVFEVEVAAGKTRSVSVTQGRVLLRLRGQAERQLDAGERFDAPADAPQAPAAASSATTEAAPPKPLHEPTSSAAPPCPAAQSFEECVDAFKRGDFVAAANQCERYTKGCSGSGHAEDAAYLRMVALARAGRSADARGQAEAYIRRFPQGFRIKEAQRIAGSD